MTIELHILDLVIIFLYFLAVFGVAYWASKSAGENSDQFFLAGRNLGWFVIGASLFASNIGSEHLIGLAGSGFSEGVPVAQYEIWAGVILLLLGWVFVPFYLKSGVATMPQFLELRYSNSARTYLAVVSVIAYVLTKISVTIFAGGVVLEAIGMDFWVGAILLVLATGIYTIFGGLRAVAYTDAMQMFVMIGGAIAVTYFGITALGGWDELWNITLQASSESGNTNGSNSFFEIWKPKDHPNYPWTGILFGAPILGIWYWCTDQFIVQRVLSAKNVQNAREGAIFAGFLKMLPLFLFVIPGIIAFALYQKGLLPSMPVVNGEAESNKALPALVKDVLPIGLRGLVVAGLFAALMSSLSSMFNSSSTLITLDFYQKFRPNAGQKELVNAGRISTMLLVLFSLLWIPVIQSGALSNQLFLYLQSIQAYISPPIAAVFLLGIFIKRLNGRGAMAALITGFVLGLLRFLLEIIKKTSLESGSPFYLFADINFLHFAILLFVICSAVLIVVSLLTSPPSPEQVEHVTYGDKFDRENISKKDIILSILLLAFIFILWAILKG
ncbi:MAG: sodium:solute symporter [Sphingobacteriales bacterium]|nr:MAG: sodium:solute symporter [Sphingobacteriales bacterium]